LQLIHLPAGGDRARALEEQLMKTAWAGEMEGWLNLPIRWNVVAPAETAAEWQSMLAGWADGAINVADQMPPERLAQFSATRAFRNEPAANLLPPEFAVRYRQQFVDRIWMRGVFVVAAIYLLAVLAYFLGVQWVRLKACGLDKQVAGIGQ